MQIKVLTIVSFILSADYSYPYATLVLSILSTAVVLAKNKVTVGSCVILFIPCHRKCSQSQYRNAVVLRWYDILRSHHTPRVCRIHCVGLCTSNSYFGHSCTRFYLTVRFTKLLTNGFRSWFEIPEVRYELGSFIT